MHYCERKKGNEKWITYYLSSLYYTYVFFCWKDENGTERRHTLRVMMGCFDEWLDIQKKRNVGGWGDVQNMLCVFIGWFAYDTVAFLGEWVGGLFDVWLWRPFGWILGKSFDEMLYRLGICTLIFLMECCVGCPRKAWYRPFERIRLTMLAVWCLASELSDLSLHGSFDVRRGTCRILHYVNRLMLRLMLLYVGR